MLSLEKDAKTKRITKVYQDFQKQEKNLLFVMNFYMKNTLEKAIKYII